MGRSQAAKAETHDRIVQIAAERLRSGGLDGVSVADLMKQAGLTVGGFYKHFATREDLVAEAVAVGQGRWQARMAEATSEEEKPHLAELIDRYLSPAHRDAPGAGCLAAALVGEIARAGPKTRGAIYRRVEQDHRPSGRPPPGRGERRRRYGSAGQGDHDLRCADRGDRACEGGGRSGLVSRDHGERRGEDQGAERAP